MKSHTIIAAMALVSAMWTVGGARAEAGPSFDCRYANAPDEAAICANPQLAQEDLEMSSAYFHFRRLSVEEGRTDALRALERTQREWLSARHQCGSDALCLRRAYDDRLQDFAYMRQVHDGPRADLPTASQPEAPLTMEQDRDRVIQEGQAHCERWPNDKICHFNN